MDKISDQDRKFLHSFSELKGWFDEPENREAIAVVLAQVPSVSIPVNSPPLRDRIEVLSDQVERQDLQDTQE
jgi:hypothetical protein